jgi:hypothetical protein
MAMLARIVKTAVSRSPFNGWDSDMRVTHQVCSIWDGVSIPANRDNTTNFPRPRTVTAAASQMGNNAADGKGVIQLLRKQEEAN